MPSSFHLVLFARIRSKDRISPPTRMSARFRDQTSQKQPNHPRTTLWPSSKMRSSLLLPATSDGSIEGTKRRTEREHVRRNEPSIASVNRVKNEYREASSLTYV